MNWIQTILAAIGTGLRAPTTFDQETAVATDVNGVTWKALLDKSAGGASPITKTTEIWGIKTTKGGVWAGTPKIRITDGTNKIFPFASEAVEGTDFVDTIVWMFPSPVIVSPDTGYIVEFRSSDAGDGAGETLALNELDIVERG